MSWNEQDTRSYIAEIQFLQRKINRLTEFSEANQEPSAEKIITILRNAQDKLYNALASHGITPEDAYRIITEAGDKELVTDILRLQGAKDFTEKQLSEPNLSSEKRQFFEESLAEIKRVHKSAWDEVRNSSNKNELIRAVEEAQEKELQKSHDHDRNRDLSRTH
jgi:FixJ family two-component response regulator